MYNLKAKPSTFYMIITNTYHVYTYPRYKITQSCTSVGNREPSSESALPDY
jgi:queuine/archaeosine tRNA-ribosyltransferase